MRKTDMNDTIFALSTPAGGAIAVVRISGSGALRTLKDIFTGKTAPKIVSHGKLTDGGEVIDDIMTVYLPSPKTYTGEDMAEMYTHGGSAVVSRTLDLYLKRAFAPPSQASLRGGRTLTGKWTWRRPKPLWTS
jgi:tRNA modification GTPase